MLLARCLRAGLILAALAPAAVDAAELPREDERWIELTTDHFTFFSSAGQRATREVADDLEELRSVLADVTRLELDSPVPIRVYVFRNEGSFKPYRHYYAYQPVSTAGYFLARSTANYIAICAAAREDASSIVYHEYVHFVASANLPRLPLWFEEGLAELYQNFQVAGGKARIGLPVWSHLALLNTAPIMSLPELFAVENGSPVYNDPVRKQSFYAQSWALVHYLLIGSESHRSETAGFVRLLHEGLPASAAFAASFTVDVAQLEKEFRSYIGRPSFSYLELPVTVDRTTRIAIREMPYAEVLYRLGDLLSQQFPPRPEAAEHFLAAIERDPTHGKSLAALGRLAEDRARWDEAEAWYRRGLTAAPDDPWVQYLGGSYLLRRGGDIAAARDALRRSLQADPSFAPAWVELAGSYVASGERSEEAIQAAETAHRLLPARSDVTANLIRLYLAAGRRDDATALAEQAFAGDPEARQRALAVVARSDVDRARRLTEDGRSDQALAALAQAEAILATSPDPLVSRHIEALRSTILDSRLAEEYNAAAGAYNAGDVERARALLQALLAEAPPGRHQEAAQSFLAFLHEPAAEPPPPAPMALPAVAGPAEIERLNELITANRLDDALRLLDELRLAGGSSPPPWIDLKIDEIRRVRADNAFVEAYNRAVGQFNGGAYAAAAATLEAALADHPESPDAAAARELLADARAALRRP